MSTTMTTYFAAAKSAAELSESLLLTSTPSTLSASSKSSSIGSVTDVEVMMLDDDFDDSSCLATCAAYGQRASYVSESERVRFDLVSGDPTAVTSAVYCFVKNFVCASGSSTVAIDNKIEQAMDLVKSHLMFAVREEVEVLKERIEQLVERIAVLESENQILRSGASQETLAKLANLDLNAESKAAYPALENNSAATNGPSAPANPVAGQSASSSSCSPNAQVQSGAPSGP